VTQPRPNRQQRRQGRDRDIPRQLEAEYIKSPLCRVIYADGAYGGPTGHGLIYMALYSDHHKLPKVQRFAVDADGKTARAEPIPQENNWIREVEAEVLMSLGFAKSLRSWLDERIKILEDTDRDVIQVIEQTKDEEGDENAD